MKKSFGAKTLAFPTPVWCVGTYDHNGKPNVMTAAWAGICCSKPPCVNVSLRKATYTYGSLMERKAFTVSIPSEKYAREADFFGIASGRDVNKFEISGLTPVKSELVEAPYVDEFPLVLECKVIHFHEIGLHTIFIGEILDVKISNEMLSSDKELPDISKLKPMVFGPEIRTYHGLGPSLGFAYDLGMPLHLKKEN
jgi:flavin reductase (DIM6/NTAB) family NADH-FMN oxidoreductase RutF